eukprot:1580992-Rhodomonas_salina.9
MVGGAGWVLCVCGDAMVRGCSQGARGRQDRGVDDGGGGGLRKYEPLWRCRYDDERVGSEDLEEDEVLEALDMYRRGHASEWIGRRLCRCFPGSAMLLLLLDLEHVLVLGPSSFGIFVSFAPSISRFYPLVKGPNGCILPGGGRHWGCGGGNSS